MRSGHILAFFGAGLAAIGAQSRADDSDIAAYAHLGAASCGSSVCHGKLDQQPDRNVWLNEYRIWSGADDHARAYRTLESEESRQMASLLGLSSATTADVCLNCHADNVPSDKRGPEFQITDGVGCEACHGGSERWIKSHAAEGATHEANLEAGMYPSESPVERAALCLTCHLGSEERFAGHDLYGAGHPRISFELENFTANQPAHFEVDDDYIARKGEIAGFNLWLAGQVEAGRRFAELVSERLPSNDGYYPELALFDCHGCHHGIDDPRWTVNRTFAGAAPGFPRLQAQHFTVIGVVISVIDAAAQREFDRITTTLLRAGQQNAAATVAAAISVADWLQERQQHWARAAFSRDTVKAVRRALVSAASDGRLSDFNAAEQLYLAVESLSYTLGDRDRYADDLDRLFAELEDDYQYRPARFEAAARSLLAAL